jgi:NADH-quinone oxidoreductase subunit H
MPEFDALSTAMMIVGVIAFVMGTVAYLILAERKVAAWVQDRIGPNRVGPWGLLQPIADGGKMFLKEDVIPSHVDRIFFVLAPIVSFSTALLAIAVVPVGPSTPPPAPQSTFAEYEAVQTAYAQSLTFAIQPGLDIGLLYLFAVSSLAVYGVILAGWSANNKYSLLGSLRSSAQIISYEIPLGMAIGGVLIYAGSLNLEQITAWQRNHGWFVFFQPLAFLLFLTAVFAETNRLPFDLPEAEQELVGGYHTEYSSSMKLGLMLLAEYAHMITTSFLLAIIFWGGWSCFGLESVAGETGLPAILLRFAILGIKVFAFVFLFLLVRWTIPRFRFDQLMSLAWKVMIPLALLHFLVVVVVRYLELPMYALSALSVLLFLGAGCVGLVASNGNQMPRRSPQAARLGAKSLSLMPQ